jgi:phosphoribosylaminoimidazole-succinocarboxamide synthase
VPDEQDHAEPTAPAILTVPLEPPERLETLVREAQGGHAAAFEALVVRFQDMAAGYAYALLRDRHLAQDAAQEAFAEAYLSLAGLREPGAFGGWLRRVVFKHCDRVTRRRRLRVARLDEALDLPETSLGPAELAEQAEARAVVRHAMAELPEPERVVTALRYAGEYTQAEIAGFLGVPVTTVNNRLHAARKRLHRSMMSMVRDQMRDARPSKDSGFVEGVLRLVRFARGKVRDVYAVGDDQLFIVSSDRVSAFDVVLPNPIPDRGKVLTQLSVYWFGQTGGIVPNHLISADLAAFPQPVRGEAEVVAGRSMLVRRAKRIDIECVARGYISGSAWREYTKQGTACGIKLPQGLVESQQLPEPIFTPAIKTDTGHDENISFDRLVELVGGALAEQLRDVTLRVYSYAATVAREKGIIIADTKMEFGQLDGKLILIDELLTPDSSRFWDAAQYQPGKTPASFDKQYLRDWLDSSGWNKEPPAPELPEDVVANTRSRYIEALERITGKGL